MQWPRISRAFTKTFHLPPANDVDFNVTLSLNLHLQHWMQRDHTVNQIQRVRADAREKPRVAAEWNGRQQEFLKNIGRTVNVSAEIGTKARGGGIAGGRALLPLDAPKP
jgi:hypothetical protein